jgi:hypothetical protein
MDEKRRKYAKEDGQRNDSDIDNPTDKVNLIKFISVYNPNWLIARSSRVKDDIKVLGVKGRG